jgi:hypothetical protein
MRGLEDLVSDSLYFYGRGKFARCNVTGKTLDLAFSTEHLPIGGKLNPDETHGGAFVSYEHGDPTGLVLYVWNTSGDPTDPSVKLWTLANLETEPDERAQKVGRVQLLVERWRRVEAADGGTSVLYQVKLRAYDEPALLALVMAGQHVVLSLHPTQYALPVVEGKVVRRQGKATDGRSAAAGDQLHLDDLPPRQVAATLLKCPECDDGQMQLGIRDDVELWICLGCPHAEAMTDPLQELAAQQQAESLAAKLASLSPAEAAEMLDAAHEEFDTREPIACPHCEDPIALDEFAIAHRNTEGVWHAECWGLLSDQAKADMGGGLVPDEDDPPPAPRTYTGGVSKAIIEVLIAEDVAAGTDEEFSRNTLTAALENMADHGFVENTIDGWQLRVPGSVNSADALVLTCSSCGADCDGTVTSAEGLPVCIDHRPTSASPTEPVKRARRPAASMAERSNKARRKK